VNGVTKQHSNTKNMIFDVYELVAFISAIMTLLPGDVIITGTPPGVGPIEVGDEVEVEIEGIGILKNRVAKE
jgi:2-keto-4-pentenoate hydratase/2-oxohepta-3-ene-1,7-dioic acid hydratase in catechol pathway